MELRDRWLSCNVRVCERAPAKSRDRFTQRGYHWVLCHLADLVESIEGGDRSTHHNDSLESDRSVSSESDVFGVSNLAVTFTKWHMLSRSEAFLPFL